MDNNVIGFGVENQQENCRDYVYSEDYISFIIRYDNDLQGVYNTVQPDCINIINSQFLIAYKKKPLLSNLESYLAYGYSSLPKCYGLMDMSVIEETGTDNVRSLSGLNLTGEGVLYGFIDTGIDYTNPIFRDALGNTRIEYIWDQTEEVMGTGETVFGYGAEYTRENINEAINSNNPYEFVPSGDEDGHGTFLASVACGGIDRENAFSGIAPNGSIAVVKLKQAKNNIRDFYIINDNAPCYGEEDIILGVKYLINKAIETAKPLVICLGLGTNQGDHNGNTNLEVYLRTIINLRGICIVAAAGNELGARTHYAGGRSNLVDNYIEDVEIAVGADDKGFSMELWGNAPGLLRVSLLSPTGERFDNIVPTRTGGIVADFLYEGTSVFIHNVVVESGSGDQLIFIRFDRPSQGIWTLRVSETVNQIGRGFDGWMPIEQFLNGDTKFVKSDPNITLCSPGNGRGAITATAYNHYNQALYVNSSRGYTRKGNIKPDITAPGVDVYGAFVGAGGTSLYTRRSGSSIGAAITAGVTGLILQWAIVNRNNLGINTEIIKQMLVRGARRNNELTYPNNAWGWGILDIYGTYEVMRNS